MGNSNDDKPVPMVLDASFLTPLDETPPPTPRPAPSSLPPLPGQAAPAPRAAPSSPSSLPPLPGQAAPAPRAAPSSLPPLPGQAAPAPRPSPSSLPPLPGQAAPAPRPVPSSMPPLPGQAAPEPLVLTPVPLPEVQPAPVAKPAVQAAPVVAPTPVAPTPVAPTPLESTAAAPAPAQNSPAADAAAPSPSPAPAAAGADKAHPSNGLTPIDISKYIPEKFHKHVDASSAPPVRLMGARAMVPMGPKDMVHVLYAGIFDPEPKIAALAQKSFRGLDERLLGSVLPDAQIAPQVLGYIVESFVTDEKKMEVLLLNRATPDKAFAYAAEHSPHASILGMVAENQERTLRCHDVIRGLRKNPKALRSDLDRAIDFLVREGIFLDDVPEFEDSFVRLGKAEMLDVLRKVQLPENVLTPEQRQAAQTMGASPEDFILGNIPDVDLRANELQLAEEQKRVPFNKLSIPMQLKCAMLGAHDQAIEALKSNNRMVAVAGIRSPKIKDADIPNIVRSKSMHEDVIRYICNNGDWTKNYSVKLGLVMHPKTPLSLVLRWMPLLRKQDLKALSKSKQIPSAVSIQAKRMLSTRGG